MTDFKDFPEDVRNKLSILLRTSIDQRVRLTDCERSVKPGLDIRAAAANFVWNTLSPKNRMWYLQTVHLDLVNALSATVALMAETILMETN